jgi:hypothetical protein
LGNSDRQETAGSENFLNSLSSMTNTYFGWFSSGVGSRAVVASTGLWSAGDTFIFSARDASDIRLFVKGKLAGSKGSAPTGVDTTTATAVFRVAGLQSGSASWGSAIGKNFIYYLAFWNRAGSAECNISTRIRTAS